MSEAAHSQSKEVRRRCESCEQRKARFRFRGVVKADRDHTLCFECFRAERERRRAQLLAEVPRAAAITFIPGRPSLTPRQFLHRRQMLEHLQSVGKA